MINNKLILILLHLSKEKLTTIEYLSEKLGVSRMTVRRYVNILLEYNIIISQEGRNGGVKLNGNFDFKRFFPTDYEKNIVFMAYENIEIKDEFLLKELKTILSKYFLQE